MKFGKWGTERLDDALYEKIGNLIVKAVRVSTHGGGTKETESGAPLDISQQYTDSIELTFNNGTTMSIYGRVLFGELSDEGETGIQIDVREVK